MSQRRQLHVGRMVDSRRDTHKSNQVVDAHEDKRYDGVVENVTPVAKVRLLVELEVGNHDADNREVSDDEASDGNKNVLRDARPWRVASSQKGRLADMISCLLEVPDTNTYMVLHRVRAWQTTSGREKRCRIHHHLYKGQV